MTSPIPTETAVLDARGKLCPEQSVRALSLAVKRRADMPAMRAAFAQFDDAELVWLIHPAGRWALLARRVRAAVVHRSKIDRRADYSMARHAAPFVRPER